MRRITISTIISISLIALNTAWLVTLTIPPECHYTQIGCPENHYIIQTVIIPLAILTLLITQALTTSKSPFQVKTGKVKTKRR